MNKLQDAADNLGTAYALYERLANDPNRYDNDMRRYFAVAAHEACRLKKELNDYQSFMQEFYDVPKI